MERRSVPIPADLAGERVDKILARLSGTSRHGARLLIEGEEGVTVDGVTVGANQRVDGGLLEFPVLAASSKVVAEHVPFTVVHEDADLLVIDKPAGVVVHPGAGQTSGTLVAGLLERYPELEGVGQTDRWGLVHRLDKETSGLLLVARNNLSYESLAAALRARQIHRRYLALVHGVMDMPTGTIDAPIGRDPAHPTRKTVAADGRPSRTHYKVLSSTTAVSLLEVTLETGRTHQIRVHLTAIEHPVVGDRTYGRRPDPVPVRRMFLHATALEFIHPGTGEHAAFESPLPPELAGILDRIGNLRS